MTYRLVFILAATGCIGVQTNPGHDTPDAPPRPDAPDPDAPPVTPDGPPTNLAPHRYIIDKYTVPQTNNDSRTYGLDLDGDTVIDNQLGLVMASLGSLGVASQPAADTAVDVGAVLPLIELEADSLQTGAARFTLLAGTNPQPLPCSSVSDPVCRHHLDGNGSFVVSVSSARDRLLTGAFTAGAMTTPVAASARLHLQLALLTPPAVTLPLLGARVTVTGASPTGIVSGVIGGAVPKADIDGTILPTWQSGINAQIAADCTRVPPSCGCTASTTGQAFVQVFDTVRDCSISLTELKTNSVMQALLATDVTIDGQPAISIGVGFHAVRATFTP